MRKHRVQKRNLIITTTRNKSKMVCNTGNGNYITAVCKQACHSIAKRSLCGRDKEQEQFHRRPGPMHKAHRDYNRKCGVLKPARGAQRRLNP
jgi:hypothetical protein